MGGRIKLSSEAKRILDEFVASRERWFGNSADYKSWDSICKVLWHDEEVYVGNAQDNSWIIYLEHLAEFCAKKLKKARLKE